MAAWGRGLSLLIVDDDTRMLELAEHAARESGHFGAVFTAIDGSDALQSLERDGHPDVVLTDLSMPGMDGFRLVRALKERATTRSIPVVMYSSSGLLYDHEHAIAAGCEAFFPKPATLAGLSEVLANVARIAIHRPKRPRGADLGGTMTAASCGDGVSPPLAPMLKGHVAATKLLIVDDKPANLLALEAVLDSPDYKLIRANSGPEALEQLRVHADIALILLDVQMPGMDGLETSRRIKQLPGCHDIPIIFITAIFTEDPFVKQGYQAGAVDYFSKPFDPEILRLKVGIYASFRQKETFLREKERQLRESEELLRTGRKLSAILESLTVGVIITDAQGRVCQTNDAVLKILKSVDQVQTDSYGEFLEWWNRDGQLLKGRDGPLMRTLLRGDASHNEVLQITCLDQTAKSVFASASPLRGLDGHIVGAVLVVQDVTAHREIEEDIEKRIVSLVTLGVEFEEVAEAAAHRGLGVGGRS
jgi:CheY-like chemotaxis protein